MLVDGHFCLHQAYHATMQTGMSNLSGDPTWAVYGFVKQMLKLLRELEPSHFAVMMDDGLAGSERIKALPEYKQDRAAPSESLLTQFKMAREACDAFGIPWKSRRPFEADDLIATYAWEACQDCDVHIFSVDKDLAQLVGPRTWFHNNMQDVTQGLDASGVEASWGVRPEQLGDLLALVGDASDCIPGVPGIGKVKAAALLSKYGSLDRVVSAACAARPGEKTVLGVGPKLLASLQQYGERALQMRRNVVELCRVPGLDAAAFRTDFRVPERDLRWLESAQAFCTEQAMWNLHAQITDEFLAAGGRSRAAPGSPTRTGQTSACESMVRVRDPSHAAKALAVLREHCGEERVFAVAVVADKTADDNKLRSACFSIYGGPDLDFGGGPRLWVDLLGDAASDELFAHFQEFFEDRSFRKVYHGFSEDWRRVASAGSEDHWRLRHSGLAGDTVHMGRLWDPSLQPSEGGSYSLEQLFFRRMGERLKLTPRVDRQVSATVGAVAVWRLYNDLKGQLEDVEWKLEGPQEIPGDMRNLSMWDCYQRYWLPLGQLLQEMERVGVPVDLDRLGELAKTASVEKERLAEVFQSWVKGRVEEDAGEAAAEAAHIEGLNLNSHAQLEQLFFGQEPVREFVGASRKHEPAEEEEQVQRCSGLPLPSADELRGLSVERLKALLRERQLPVSGRKAALVERLLDPGSCRRRRARPPPLRVTVRSLGLKPSPHFITKKGGRPQTSMEALSALLAQEQEALRADGVKAVESLLEFQETEALLSGFLTPLQRFSTTGRVHAFLNLNTTTGRLSCREPNLQGEPVGKRIPVRDVFAAPPGRRLIVADYAQLELRVVAHLSDCHSMAEILCSGGDIHSQTACRMFDEVRRAVGRGDCFVDEASAEPGSGAAPLVKDCFPEQRKRAKELNFGLLYGKTAFGLSRDWGVSQSEAQAMIDSWFDAFPEVRAWRLEAMESAGLRGARTLLGRARPLRDLDSRHRVKRSHALRAASNSPVQGSAADLVIAAMLGLDRSELLQKCGYQQVLQVHDEIILEGPRQHADDALAEVVRIMEDPLPFRLRVPLRVTAQHVRTWHEGKP